MYFIFYVKTWETSSMSAFAFVFCCKDLGNQSSVGVLQLRLSPNEINKANPLGYHYSYSGKYEEMKAKFSPSFLFSLLTYLHLCFVDHQIAHIVKPSIQKHLFLDRKRDSVCNYTLFYSTHPKLFMDENLMLLKLNPFDESNVQ